MLERLPYQSGHFLGPLDLQRMVVDDPDAVPEVCKEFQELIDRAEGRRFQLAKIERFAFYERARQAFALVQTGETRLYGNVLLKMGVIRPQ